MWTTSNSEANNVLSVFGSIGHPTQTEKYYISSVYSHRSRSFRLRILIEKTRSFFMKKIEFEQQKSSRLMVVNQEISKHQDSNAGNETKKNFSLTSNPFLWSFWLRTWWKTSKLWLGRTMLSITRYILIDANFWNFLAISNLMPRSK